MAKPHFYASGLKFSCKRCSSCCRYESGFVYLSEDDVEKLMSALNMDRKAFIAAYCRWVAMNKNEVLSLKEKSNKDCVFWEDGCTVYDSRPFQCVSFPFWENIVASSQSWEMAASGCPGINTGELRAESVINEIVKSRKRAPVINRTSERLNQERFLKGAI